MIKNDYDSIFIDAQQWLNVCNVYYIEIYIHSYTFISILYRKVCIFSIVVVIIVVVFCYLVIIKKL